MKVQIERISFTHDNFNHEANLRRGTKSEWVLQRWNTNNPKIPPVMEVLAKAGWVHALKIEATGAREPRAFSSYEEAVRFVEHGDPEPVKVGDRFIYTHNGSYVEITKITPGRWPTAELRFVDGGALFNSGELVHYLEQDKHGFWERTS